MHFVKISTWISPRGGEAKTKIKQFNKWNLSSLALITYSFNKIWYVKIIELINYDIKYINIYNFTS